MNELPHLTNIFDRLKRGYHLGPDDEPEFSALCGRSDEYATYFAAIGLKLVRHEREKIPFELITDNMAAHLMKTEKIHAVLVGADRIAANGDTANKIGTYSLALPHFTLDRYAALLRQVDVHDLPDLQTLLKHMERIGWVKWLDEDQFRFLRPFHRVFSKCLEIADAAQSEAAKGDGSQGSESKQRPVPTPPTDE